MPKYRKLYVKTTESLDLNDMPDDFTRLMWVLLPLGLCRHGRGIDNPSWVKAKLFPLRTDVTPGWISNAMDWYEERGMIQRYEIDGRRYFCVPTFHTYQGNTEREAESDYPAPPDETAQDSRPAQDLLSTNSSSDAVCNMQYAERESETQKSLTTAKGQYQGRELHPALAIYCEQTGLSPPKSDQWKMQIVETVGALTPRLDLWSQVIHGWVGMGWKSTNIAGMLDRFRAGDIPKPGERNDGRTGSTRKRKTSDAPVITGLGKKPDI